MRRARRVQIDGAAPYQIDGDFGGDSPLTVSLLSTPARLYAPAPPAR